MHAGCIRVPRVRVLPLLRQPFVHFKFAHGQPVSYIATQIRQHLQRETGKTGRRRRIGAQFLRVLEAEGLHSTASSFDRVLQKIGTSVQLDSVWPGVTFQLVDVPRWIPDTHGAHFHFSNFPSLFSLCFVNWHEISYIELASK